MGVPLWHCFSNNIWLWITNRYFTDYLWNKICSFLDINQGNQRKNSWKKDLKGLYQLEYDMLLVMTTRVSKICLGIILFLLFVNILVIQLQITIFFSCMSHCIRFKIWMSLGRGWDFFYIQLFFIDARKPNYWNQIN